MVFSLTVLTCMKLVWVFRCKTLGVFSLSFQLQFIQRVKIQTYKRSRIQEHCVSKMRSSHENGEQLNVVQKVCAVAWTFASRSAITSFVEK